MSLCRQQIWRGLLCWFCYGCTAVIQLFWPRLLTVLHAVILFFGLLTPWCRILFEKLIVTQLIKNILLSLWNPKVHHRVRKGPPLDPILSQLNPVCHIDLYLPKIQLNVILLPTPRSFQWFFIFGHPNQNPVNTCPLTRACHMSHPPHPPWFNHPNNIRWRIQAVKFIIMQFSPRSLFLPFRSKYP
jgi:hypothetical protein